MALPTHDDSKQKPTSKEFAVKVNYLPATAPFHDRFPEETPVETVRQAAMSFFGVTDHQDRDTHVFRLQCGGIVVTDTSQPISNLVEHGRELHCDLVEEITAG